MRTANHLVPPFVEKGAIAKSKTLATGAMWRSLRVSHKRLVSAAFGNALPFHWKRNAANWTMGVYALIQEIAYGYCWMCAYADFFTKNNAQEDVTGFTDFTVSYFADNCITRIHSCRDKIALMVWSFYVPFDPRKRIEIPTYNDVLRDLKAPRKAGLALSNHTPFIQYLKSLKGGAFKRIEKYRHIKIHRMEPRIEIYRRARHNELMYVIPVRTKEDEAILDTALKQSYSDADVRKRMKQHCYIDGELFDSRSLDQHTWEYASVERDIQACLTSLIEAASGCFKVLRRRAPFRKVQSQL